VQHAQRFTVHPPLLPPPPKHPAAGTFTLLGDDEDEGPGMSLQTSRGAAAAAGASSGGAKPQAIGGWAQAGLSVCSATACVASSWGDKLLRFYVSLPEGCLVHSGSRHLELHLSARCGHPVRLIFVTGAGRSLCADAMTCLPTVTTDLPIHR
jgi:hypothetical protein